MIQIRAQQAVTIKVFVCTLMSNSSNVNLTLDFFPLFAGNNYVAIVRVSESISGKKPKVTQKVQHSDVSVPFCLHMCFDKFLSRTLFAWLLDLLHFSCTKTHQTSLLAFLIFLLHHFSLNTSWYKKPLLTVFLFLDYFCF